MTIVPLPVEDMYPRPGARPVDDALVDKIADSMRLVGFVESRAVEVRPAGNTYVIIDGQHRVEAAKRAGLTTIPAKVEDADDAAALTFEGVLNLQRADTDAERFARLQDFLDLGDAGTPQQIAVATGITPEQQEQVRRVRQLVNDPVAIRDQGSLDRILAIGEFADDPEAVERILTASENLWQSVVRELRMARERAKNMRAAIEIAKGYDLINGEVPGALAWVGRGEEIPEGATHVKLAHNEWSATVDLIWYAPAESVADPEEAKQREAEERRISALEAAAANRINFIVEYLNGHRPGATNALRDFAVISWESGRDAERGYLDPEPWSEVHGFLARIYAAILARVEYEYRRTLAYRNEWQRANHGEEALAYHEALKDSGYVATNAEEAELMKVRTVVEEADNG